MTIINLHEGPKPTMAPDAMVFHEPRKDISPSRAIATSIAIPFFFVGLLIGGFGWSFLMIGALINHMGEE